MPFAKNGYFYVPELNVFDKKKIDLFNEYSTSRNML